MSTVLPSADKLLSIEEFAALPKDERKRELVRGKVIDMNLPKPKHGFYCAEIAAILRNFVKPRKLGRVFSNDSGVITEHEPDSMRGPDVGFYSYANVPEGDVSEEYFDVVPELAVEVVSCDDVWARVLEKVAELLDAGVKVVCSADPRDKTVQVHRSDKPVQHLSEEEEITFPEVLPGFSCQARDFFDI
jgi:Uma2 family endonuclease